MADGDFFSEISDQPCPSNTHIGLFRTCNSTREDLSGLAPLNGKTIPIERESISCIARPPRAARTLLTLSVAYCSNESSLKPSLTPLQQLYRLDKLSPQFPDRLTDLLREQEREDYAADLQGEDLSWLVEYLDDVRPRDAFTNSLLKPD